MTADWNAGVYHRVSEPQLEWGRTVLARLALTGRERVADVGCGTGRLTRELADRVPQGALVAVDQSASMLSTAAGHLAGLRVRLVRASADALPFAGVFDVVFSTATFHWVLDHDALFRSIFTALRPGGRLHAQCGGGPNLARLRRRAAILARTPEFAPYFGADWREPWHYADATGTETRLVAAGFVSATCTLEPAPTAFDDMDTYRTFVEHVCLRPYLDRLPETHRERFATALTSQAAADDPPFVLDYQRLNINATRPERSSG